jgi:NADPH-dependent glutamate synthase beta subunit-like oxidoreductase
MSQQPSHCVAVVGGAVAGAEVAGCLAEAGVEVVVFPLTGIGSDIGFDDLVNEWGFSGVVLACGAWRDRPLPVEGADAYLDRGLIYQNPFIIWFNHANEKAYQGPRFEPRDGAIVVGGGLASIDVAKALMLETVRAKLDERGIQVPMLELEVRGIPKILARHELTFEDLGLEGCTIYYRRRVDDMPLVEMPEGADEKRAEKVRASRRKLVEKAMDKYRFKMEPLCMPDGLIVEDERLVGLRFRRTRMEKGRPVPTDETFERRGCYVISSIGSIPAPIEGIPMKGELFEFVDWELGRLADYPTVFSAGNVATGKGNIVASRKHAKALAATLVEASEAASAGAREQGEKIAAEIRRQPPIAADALDRIRERVRQRQQAVGYDGDFAAWIERVTPPDLE